MVKSQIDNLTPDPSFGHNLCFNYPNESWKPILDIYVPRAFQWYKELFNPMSFDPCNLLRRFESPLGLQLPKWELIWECEGPFSHILLHSQEHEMWLLGSLLGCTFASPCVDHEPKARVVTFSKKGVHTNGNDNNFNLALLTCKSKKDLISWLFCKWHWFSSQCKLVDKRPWASHIMWENLQFLFFF